MATAKKKIVTKTSVTTWEDIKKRRAVEPALARKVRAESEAYIAVFPLIELRENFSFTQVALAAEIGIDQSNVSRIERGKLSKTEIATLQKYVEALGGTLEINARFGNKVHAITNSELLSAEADW